MGTRGQKSRPLTRHNQGLMTSVFDETWTSEEKLQTNMNKNVFGEKLLSTGILQGRRLLYSRFRLSPDFY
jgi:hypothetical protein